MEQNVLTTEYLPETLFALKYYNRIKVVINVRIGNLSPVHVLYGHFD